MRFVCVGGNDTLLCLSQCIHSDQEGPAFLLDSFLSKCLDPDGIGVLPQRGRQGGRVGESGKR